MNKRRVRMIAGPNGSGKSTLKKGIEQRLIGTYMNKHLFEILLDVKRAPNMSLNILFLIEFIID